MRVGIIVFPGSNCDRDVHHVLCDVGADPQYVWHQDPIPPVDAVILPGGFSYGDRLRAGAIAAHSPSINRIRDMEIPILGICNGFQILAEAGLLPGVLLPNDGARFMCRWTTITYTGGPTPFTNGMAKNQKIPIPVANGEGQYYADPDTITEMERNNQIIFRYDNNINGSAIAGVCNYDGNILGMMPHPERAAEPDINPYDSGPARSIFESLVGS